MKSILFRAIALTAALLVQAANHSSASAQQPETPDAITLAAVHSPIPFSPMWNMDPQYPINLGGFDGVHYLYSTDCCEDGHFGVLLSANGSLTLGCEGGQPVQPIEVEIPFTIEVPAPPGGGTNPAPGTNPDPGTNPGQQPDPGQPGPGQPGGTPEKCFLFIDPALKTTPMPTQFRGLANNSVMSNDYDANEPLGTSVALVDKNGVRRYFTLVRYKHVGKLTVKNPDGTTSKIDFNTSFPMLILARTTPERRITFGPGQPIAVVAPKLQVPAAGDINLPNNDFSQNDFSIIEIPLPDPQNLSNTAPQKCVLINRPN